MTEPVNQPDYGFEPWEGGLDTVPARDVLLDFVNSVIRKRYWVVGGAVLVASVVVAGKLLSSRTYTSTSQLVTESGTRSVSNLAGLAAQFGVSVPTGNEIFSPQFYVDLLQSDVILRKVVGHRFTYPSLDSGLVTRTLVDIYGIKLGTPEKSSEFAVGLLRNDARPTFAVKTGVIKLEVRAVEPGLAAAVNQRLLDVLDEFNNGRLHDRGAAERRFLDGRLKFIQGELGAAEGRVERFLEENREFRGSPELTFDYERLMADVNLQRQVQASLAAALEKAKVDEIRDIPVLTTLQEPTPPVWPDSRGTVRAGLIAMVLGGMLGMGVASLRDRIADAA